MKFHEQLEAAGHVLIREYGGDIDFFVLDYDYHNGPGCVNCDQSWCQHCGEDIEPCIGRAATDAANKASRYQQYLKLKEEFEWEDRSGGQFTQEELSRSGRDFS